MPIYAEDLPEGAKLRLGVPVGQQKKGNNPSKYHAKKTARGNIKFPSEHEAKRFDELMLLLKAGKISDLRLQEEFVLQEGYTDLNGERVRPITYRADFTYSEEVRLPGVEEKQKIRVVEDAKGVRTPEYKIKRKMMQSKYGISIRET